MKKSGLPDFLVPGSKDCANFLKLLVLKRSRGLNPDVCGENGF
jgi:hypothetical protein